MGYTTLSSLIMILPSRDKILRQSSTSCFSNKGATLFHTSDLSRESSVLNASLSKDTNKSIRLNQERVRNIYKESEKGCLAKLQVEQTATYAWFTTGESDTAGVWVGGFFFVSSTKDDDDDDDVGCLPIMSLQKSFAILTWWS